MKKNTSHNVAKLVSFFMYMYLIDGMGGIFTCIVEIVLVRKVLIMNSP